MNQCVALIIGAKIQNGYKILSIATYYKGKLAYPHFSIVIYPLYHRVTGTIHQGEINWLLSTNGRRPQTQEKAFNIFHPFISQVLEKLLVLGCASAAQYHTKLVFFFFFSCLITIQSYWILDWIRTSVQIWGQWCTLYTVTSMLYQLHTCMKDSKLRTRRMTLKIRY